MCEEWIKNRKIGGESCMEIQRKISQTKIVDMCVQRTHEDKTRILHHQYLDGASRRNVSRRKLTKLKYHLCGEKDETLNHNINGRNNLPSKWLVIVTH